MKFIKENTSVENSKDASNAEIDSAANHDSDGVNRITLEFNKKGIKTTIKYIVGIAFIILSIAWILNNDTKVSVMIDKFMNVLSPFIAGFAIAFLLNVLMRPLENIWLKIFKDKNKVAAALKRPVCLFLSIVLMFGFLVAVLFMIIPEFINTFNNIVDVLPDYADKAIGWYNQLRAFAQSHNVNIPEFNFNPEIIINFLKDNFANQNTISKTIDFTASLVTGIINFIVSIAFSIYLLAQKEKLANNLRRTLYAFLPEKRINRIVEIAGITDQTFTKFVSGQLLEALIIGLLCFIGMLIFKMPYASVISVLVGFTALIPVFGAFIGTAIGAFLILFDSPIKALWFIVFIIVLQQLEGNLIYPKVVGKTVGLPGIWVLTAVTIGGNTFGVLGILLAVPACAVLYTLLRSSVNNRNKAKKEKAAPQTEEQPETESVEETKE